MKKISDFFEKTTPIYSVVKYAFIVAYVFYALFPKPVMVGFYFGTAIVNFLAFIFYKDYVKDGDKEWKFFIANVCIFFVSFPLYLLKFIEQATNSHIPILVKALISVTVAIFSAALLVPDSDKKKEKFDEIKVKETLSGGSGQKDDGDIIICKNKDTKKDVILYSIDRFVHLFVLGPTGCGKTSQVLLPMLEQDIRKGHGVIVMEPKGDLAIKVYAMGKYYNQPVLYFNPVNPDCPYFNPLDGRETQVVETIRTTFNMLSPDSATYFQNVSNDLLEKSIKLIKRIEAAYTDPATGISSKPATLITLNDVLTNTANRGRDMVNELTKIPTISDDEEKENKDIADWFLNEYWRDKSKIHENSSNVRMQVAALIQNEYLRRVLNPADGKSQFSFDDILEQGGRIAICTAQGELQDRGKYLGLFLMLSIQASIFRRKGDEFTRKPCYLYMDEFQTYANNSFGTILEQGRSYRVAAILATQSRARIKQNMGRDGEGFLATVSTNARNVIVFPGLDNDDNDYYSNLFGEEIKKEVQYGETRQKFEFGHGFQATSYPSEQKRYTEKEMARYSKTDISEKVFGEFTYRLIEHNSVGKPADGVVTYIDSELDNNLNKIVYSYSEEQERKSQEQFNAMTEERKKLYAKYQIEKNGGQTSGTSEAPAAPAGAQEGTIKVKNNLGAGFGSSSNRNPIPTISEPSTSSDDTAELKVTDILE